MYVSLNDNDISIYIQVNHASHIVSESVYCVHIEFQACKKYIYYLQAK